MIKSLSTVSILLLTVGCSTPEKSDNRAAEEGATAALDPGSAVETESPAADVQVPGQSNGTFTVLGLRIPNGMKPTKAPTKIFRFEGFVGVSDATESIKEQIRPKWTKAHGSGVVFEDARVRVPQGNATGSELLNVRVYKSPRGAAIIDVWRATGSNLQDEETLKIHRKKSQGSGYQRTRLNKPGKETMRVLDKRSRGQKPSKEDQNSPFYY